MMYTHRITLIEAEHPVDAGGIDQTMQRVLLKSLLTYQVAATRTHLFVSLSNQI